jgi:hypothetical protein
MKYVTIDDATGTILQESAQPVEWEGATCRMAPDHVASDTHRWDQSLPGYALLPPPAPPSIDDLLAAAQRAIDAAAGAARLRYITDVPGQEAVYLRKAEQARAFRDAGYAGEPPPYVAAEAAAIDDTPQVACDGILAIAEYWDDVLSPAIEGGRIAGKRDVSAAAAADDRDGIDAILQQTLAALRAI